MSIMMLLLIDLEPCYAEVEWSVNNRIKIDAQPLDVAISLNDKWIFVLNDQGEVLIFAQDGKLRERIKVGKHIDQIEVGPRENMIYLTSRKNKTVEMVALEFIQNINTVGSPCKGPVDAPIVMVVFTDFECPYCAETATTLDQVLRQYPKDVKLVFKNFPLQQIHKFSGMAAVAALAADSQGKFWEFHDLLFKDYDKLNDQKLKEIVKKLNLNEAEFDKKMTDPQIIHKIRQDLMDGVHAEVRGTPTVFINGRMLKDRTMEGFKASIDSELSKIRKKR